MQHGKISSLLDNLTGVERRWEGLAGHETLRVDSHKGVVGVDCCIARETDDREGGSVELGTR